MSRRVYGGLQIRDAQEIAWYDSDSSNFAAFKAPAALTGDTTWTLPDGDSTGTQALVSNGSGALSWSDFLGTSLTSANIFVGNGSGVATGVAMSGDISIDNTGATAIAAGVIVNADINAAAAVAFSKMEALTASRALVSDGSGVVSVSSVTATELGYVSGVTSSIQTQLNTLDSTISNFEWQPSALDYVVDNTAVPATEVSGDRYVLSHDGGAPNAAWDGASAGDIVEFDGASWVATTPSTGTFIAVDDEPNVLYLWGGASWASKAFESTTASTGLTKVGFDVRLDSSAGGDGLGFAAGVLSVNVDDSTIETNTDALRLKDGGITDAKVNASAAIALSKLAAVTASRALVSDGSGFVSASAVTSTELGYVSGVTSAIQTQIDGKAGTALDNLASVAINTSLVSDTDNTDDLGSAAIGWANVYGNAVHMDSNSQTTSLQGSASASASVTYSLPAAAPAANGYVLASTTGGVMSWVDNASVSSFQADWATGDGTTKAITHNLGTKDVIIQVYDKSDDQTIQVDTETRTDTNTVTLTSSAAPGASGWRVIVLAT
jgi:hypothetical protein